jgi:glutamine cyclotransferase
MHIAFHRYRSNQPRNRETRDKISAALHHFSMQILSFFSIPALFRSTITRLTFFCLALLVPCAGCHSQPVAEAPMPPSTPVAVTVRAKAAPFTIVKSFPHDRTAFTQGLLWHDGALYESTGLEGKSTIRRVDLASGKVLQQQRQTDEIFSEGLALTGNKLIQISWKNQRAFVYDLKTFEKLGEWSYQGEGWGLTSDGHDLIMSDGSQFLTWRDPQTFEEKKRVAVTLDGKPLRNLNELEWINGEVWANVWQTDYIARIDPQTGVVKSYLDCRNLLGANLRQGGEDVLNGIAYDPQSKRIFITGKLWPRLFEIKLKDPTPAASQ